MNFSEQFNHKYEKVTGYTISLNISKIACSCNKNKNNVDEANLEEEPAEIKMQSL